MSNVVNLFENKEKKAEDDKDEGETFDDAIARNQKNKERVERERQQKNKMILRQYRIK